MTKKDNKKAQQDTVSTENEVTSVCKICDMRSPIFTR